MSVIVRPIVCLVFLVFLLSSYATRAQRSPDPHEKDTGRTQQSPNLDDILLRLKQNLDQYLTTLPSFFCNEHVVSQMRHELSVKSFRNTVTDSIFRIKRTPSQDPMSTLVESRNDQRINGTPTEGEGVKGPSILSGAFTGGLAFVSIDQKACVGYNLNLIDPDPKSNRNRVVYEVDFASLPKSERPSSCVISEDVVGSALIDSENMQIDRIELTVPRRIVVPASHNPERAASEVIDGTWAVSVDYASVLLGDKPFWMPKAITSILTNSGSNPIIWSFTAQYNNYHKLEVTSHVLPFSGEVPTHPDRP
jgi:hypothetical protein